MMNPNAKIYVAGHTGLAGSALMRMLHGRGYTNLITRPHAELDLMDENATAEFFGKERPEYVFMAAALVGGIVANHERPADFLGSNLKMAVNVIGCASALGVKKLLFLGSSCIYPKFAEQPIQEEALLSGPLEPTNEGYAIAKIAGVKLCQAVRRQYGHNFISAMPCNLYGENDNYHPEYSHVIPGLIQRFHEAKMNEEPRVVCWGTGKPLREFLHADDLAEACLVLMNHYHDEAPINVGSGEEWDIARLTRLVALTVGYAGEIAFDASYPDGTPRKVMDSSRIREFGWEPKIGFEEGLRRTYMDFLKRAN